MTRSVDFAEEGGDATMRLKIPTSPKWLELALREFDAVLADHAHCEKKAAATALSLLQSYPEVPGLPAHMAGLAREECTHLARVLRLLEARGLSLGRDGGDPYALGLTAHLRKSPDERRLDRLLLAGIIEARSCERLELLAGGLADPELRQFYAELATSESGHMTLFLRLAGQVATPNVVGARLEQLLEAEAELIRQLPIRAAVH